LTVRHGIARGRDASCPDQALPRRALLFALSLAAIPLSAWAQAPGDDREQLRKRIDDLEQRVRELESTSVLSEPETRVKRIETWVDDDGVEHDTPAPGTRRVVTYQRERVYRRQTINEKIEDALSDAEGRRVQLGVNAAIVLQSARQAEGSDTQADGNAYQLASTDLYFTAGLARYTVFFADIVGLADHVGEERQILVLVADEVVDRDVASLTVTIEASIALLQLRWIPGTIEVQEVARGVLEVQAFSGGIGREQQAHGMRRIVEGILNQISIFLVHAVGTAAAI